MKPRKKRSKITEKNLPRKCEAECYEYFATQKSISLQQAAGLLNGYFIKDNKPPARYKIKLDISKICTAISNKYVIKIDDSQKINDYILLDTKSFFHWATKAYKGFFDTLPDSVKKSVIFASPGTFNNRSYAQKEFRPPLNKNTDIDTLITENNKLKSEIDDLINKINELGEKNWSLEKEIKVLRPLAQLGIKFKENQSKKGKSKKNYHY